MCREVYEDAGTWAREKQTSTKQAWPEYKEDPHLVSKPSYLSSDMDDKEWRRRYLAEDVEKVAQLKQHHVHVMNAKGERVPLSHCRRADNPNKCNS